MVGVFMLSACKKEGLSKYDVVKSFPDSEVKLEDLKKAIATGTDGFKMIIRSSGGALAGGYLKFETGTNAKFVVDNNEVNAATPQESAYSLKVSQTNSVISFSKTGKFALFAQGMGIDTTYTYKSSVGDTLKFLGDITGAKLSLVKTSKKDGDEFLAGKMSELIKSVASIKNLKKYFKRLSVGGQSYDLMIDEVTKILTINYNKGNAFTSFSTRFVYSNNGIEFEDALIDGTVKIGSLNDLQINLTDGTLKVSVAGTAATFTNELTPVTIDKTAAIRFVGVDQQWASLKGFTKDGVADYLNISGIPGLSRLTYWAKYDDAYDVLGFTFGTSIRYGPALIPRIAPTGIVVFELDGVLGTLPTIADQRSKVIATINHHINASGFYVVQTGPGTYDFVSVKDGNIWISYQAIG